MTTPKLFTHDQIREKLDGPIRSAKILTVATEAGLTQQALSGWLNKRSTLSDEAIARVAKIVGYQVESGYRINPLTRTTRG